MRYFYDPEVDILWLRLSQRPIAESDELQPGLILDFAGDGKIVGIEIHEASQRADNPREIEFVPAA